MDNMAKKLNRLWAVLIVVFVLLFVNFTANEIMIYRYNNGEYVNNIFSFMGVMQPYIADYNKGNIYYNRQEYEKAIEFYKKALQKNPPQKKECKIRINMVLSILETIDFDNARENKEEVIAILDECIDILCEDGCADCDNVKGHSKDATTLKEDIEKYKDELEQDNNEVTSDEEEPKKEEEQLKDNNNEEEEKQKKLQDLQDEAQEERNKELRNAEELSDIYDNYSEHYEGKYW